MRDGEKAQLRDGVKPSMKDAICVLRQDLNDDQDFSEDRPINPLIDWVWVWVCF